MNRFTTALWVFCFTSLAALAADPADWSEGILSEEQRQNYASSRVENVSAQLRDLIFDLESNGLLEQNGGAELLSAIEVLANVKDTNIQQAIVSLREARGPADSARTHLDKADGEIENAVTNLTALLRLSSGFGAAQLLRQEVRRLLRQEESVWGTCRGLGRSQLEGTPIKPADLTDAATTQMQLAKLASKVQLLFPEAAAEATDQAERARITKAGVMFGDGQVVALLGSAAQNITEGNLLEAVTPQKEAIDILIAIDTLLGDGATGGGDDLSQIVAALQEILRKQRELRTQTEAASEPEFASQRRPWQGRQRDLRTELGRIDANKFEPEAGGSNPLNDAGQAMGQAEAAFQASQQLEAVPQQRAAEAALERAIAMLEKQIAEKNKPAEAKLADPISAMKKYAQLLKQLAADQKALREATQKLAANSQEVTTNAAPQETLIDRLVALGEMRESEPPSIKSTLRRAYFAMEDAFTALKKNDAPVAVPAQIKAEEALLEASAAAEAEAKEMEKIAKKDAELDAIQKIAQFLLAEQQPITAATEEAKPEEVPQNAPEQSALAEKAKEASEQTPSEASPDLAKAAEAMKAAAAAMKQGDKEKAKSEQSKASEALKSAAQKAASKKSKGKAGQNKDEGKRGGKMKGKGKSKGAKGDGKDGEGEGEGGSPKPSAPAPPTPPRLAPVKLTGKNIDAKGQERYFAKGEVSGKRSDDTTSDWEVLGTRDQEELTERYIKKLPVEYRDMLKEYYQALAADE
ncbi:MAG: hypothetical protein ACI9UA_001871 [Pseudoalteromonas tetraodonis]|jgi:hypothetical protein